MDKNSALFWFPKVKGLDIPMPETVIVVANKEDIKEYYDCDGDAPNLKRMKEEIKKIIKENFNLPVFIKTDIYSHKWGWKESCFLDDINNLDRNMFELLCGSRLADMMGLEFNGVMIRKYIPMDSKFTSFWGDMPINPERRYFVKDGEVLCRHPYWIEEAVSKSTKKPSNWWILLKKVNSQTTKEIRLLSHYAKLISKKVEGCWSVDFCKAKDGRWIFIDMALGKDSWHPEACKNFMKIKEYKV